MKQMFRCYWYTLPGMKRCVKAYPSHEAARRAAAKALTDAVDLHSYIRSLRCSDDGAYSNCADFLENFLTDLRIPEENKVDPSVTDTPENCIIRFDSDEVEWKCMSRECPVLLVKERLYADSQTPDEFIVDFNFDAPENNGAKKANCFFAQINAYTDYGTSPYPLMVWWVLDEKPQTQDKIAEIFLERFKTKIDRKTVGRHLQLLRNFGFPVQVCTEGYYRDGEKSEPRTDVKYTPAAYPLLILHVLHNTPKTKSAIIQAVQEKFGNKIGRRAVGEHLDMLKAFGYNVCKSDDGYYLGK